MPITPEQAERTLAIERMNVRVWLEAVSRACQRELAFLADTGDLADSEIDVPYRLLEDAIKRLRDAQLESAIAASEQCEKVGRE